MVYTNKIIFCVTFLLFSTLSGKTFETLTSKGFIEICNPNFLKEDYNRLYENFDKFIDVMTKDKEFSEKFRLTEKEFLAKDKQKKRYCSAPPSYRNPKEDTTKRHNKIYFQFLIDHYRMLKNNYALELKNKPEVICFLEEMAQIDTMAKKMFTAMLDKFEKKNPGIKKLFYGNHQELTVVTKIVRYEKGVPDQWGTTAHCDKSGFTFIWDSSDENNESLLICEDLETPSLDKLVKPERKFSHKADVTSTIMINGSALSKVGIDITVHGVAPIKNYHRFAIISFLLIPDIDMNDIKTDFEPKG